MEKSKSLWKRAVFYFIVMLVMLYLLLLAVSLLMSFAEYKLDITGDIAIESILQTVKHPVKFVSDALTDKNPFVIIGGVFIVGYTIVLYVKSYTKQKSWEIDKKDTHGSAKWMDRRELSADENYQLTNQKNFFSDWKNVLKGGGTDERHNSR